MKLAEVNRLSAALLVVIVVFSMVFGVLFAGNDEFVNFADEILIIVLSLVAVSLYLVGGGIILFGSILLAARYVIAKLRAPTTPFGSLPRVTFLTLGLEIMIGAELINTAVQRTFDDFLLLMLTIGTRGLIGLILYLEKRWHHEEYEAHKEEIERSKAERERRAQELTEEDKQT